MMNALADVIDAYDAGTIGRRDLLLGLSSLLLSPGARAASDAGPKPSLFRGRTINHVTILVSDVPRSKAFYQQLTGLPVRDEGPDFCELRCQGSFLGLYAKSGEPKARLGIDHFCVGVDAFDAKKAFQKLKDALPMAKPTLEEEDTQVYLLDPDGVRVQLSDVGYKR